MAIDGSTNVSNQKETTGTARVKRGLADMLKGGVIMDVVTPEQAKIAEDAGATAVMASSACQLIFAQKAEFPACLIPT